MVGKPPKVFREFVKTAGALQVGFQSEDPAVARKAEADLRGLGVELKTWAATNGVKLETYRADPPGDAGSGPVAMKKCQTVIFPVINGKVNECVLVGQDGRKCVYSCQVATLSPS